MKRDLQFIAQDEVTGDWVSGYPLMDADVEGRWYLMNNYSDGIIVKPETIRQYTGLKDKNGKEIYEGDILREPQNTSYKFRGTGEVVYESDYGGFAVVGSYHKNQHYELLTCDVAHDCEVIGNIYENPDLLK